MLNFDQVIDRRGTYSTQWDYIEDRFGERGLLPFSISDTDFKAPQAVIDAIMEFAPHGIYGYSRWNHADFKSAITGWYEKRFHAEVDGDWILYSPTVCYSLSILIQLKSRVSDEVVVFSPKYDGFNQIILRNKRKMVHNDLLYKDGFYSIDFALLEQQLKTAAILLLTNPHNPTGRVFTREELKTITNLCEKHGVFLISDDIHMDIVYKGSRYTPVLAAADDVSNCCICTSMSKSMNTPGLVGSYLLVPDAGFREEILNILKGRDALSSVSIFGMRALMAGYREGAGYIDSLVSYLDGNMDIVSDFLREKLPLMRFRKPEGTYLAWIDAQACRLPDEEIQKRLVQVGKVGIMPGSTYDRAGFLRMNIACPREKLLDGLSRMEKALGE